MGQRPRSQLRGLYNALVDKEPMERFRLLRKLAAWLRPDYRLKWPDMDWWEDPYFNHHLARFDETAGLNTDRRWMMYQLQRLTTHLPGATAECGVHRGASSYQIAEVNRAFGHSRTHHAFDSFAGLSAPEAVDGGHWQEGDLAVALEDFRRNLADFGDDVVAHPGWIPEGFGEVEGETFAFVHVDVDLYQPTLDSVRFFYPRLTPGGILLCDDYGLRTCPGATRACDEFLADKPEKIISLSAGSGFLIKGTPTSAQLAP